MPVREVHQIFLEAISTPAAVALVRCAVRACEMSRQIVRQCEFSPRQARDVLPYIRRAEFESGAGAIVVPGVRVHTQVNNRGTSSFVELSTPKASVTALTRNRPPISLPKAVYRESRAEVSQLSLFEERSVANENGRDDRIYGCFVYGGAGPDLEMARIYFPLPGRPLKAIVPLDLLVVYASVVDAERAASINARPTEEAVEVAMELKRKKKEGTEG